MKKYPALLSRAGVVVVGTGLMASQTYAAGTADLVAGFDKVDIIAGITAAALLLAAVLSARKGVRMVLGMFK